MRVTSIDLAPGKGCQFLLIAVLAAALFPGCSLLEKFRGKSGKAPERPVKRTRQVQLIGAVVMVNEEGKFVLIDNGSNPSPGMGATVQCRMPDGTSAELRVTEIRKRPFVIADVISGVPQKNAQVYW
jgi:hypothetical protein